jgi:uncharacterized surface protein with fasciclin (FAS1) repeats
MKRFLALGLLLTLTAAPAFAGSCGSSKAVSTANLVETADSAGNFTTLLAAAQASGLASILADGGPYTVFAPTDEAFKKLPAGTVDTLLKNPDQLREVLLYHVVPGKVLAADVVSLDSAKTAQGSDVAIQVANGGVMVNNASVIATDIEASNGVIHVIDTVILPAS